MKSAILSISAAALLVMGVASTEASASTGQYPYRYERREAVEHRAFDNGERDGYAKGIDDVRHHRRADITRQRWYRNGDHAYDREWGSREAYRVDYRRGFEAGYDRAYREGWRR